MSRTGVEKLVYVLTATQEQSHKPSPGSTLPSHQCPDETIRTGTLTAVEHRLALSVRWSYMFVDRQTRPACQ